MKLVAASLFALFALSSPLQGVVHVFEDREKPVSEIRGVVLDPVDFPMPGVKIEVYDHPEVWSDENLRFNPDERAKRQHKLREFVTKEDGKFRLQGVKAGRYELRVTLQGFNPTSIIFTLAAPGQKTSRDGLTVHMHLST
jgi:hypothetical protein